MKIYTKKLIAVLLIFSATLGFSQTVTWTNGNGTNIFSDPLNWSTSAVPSNADNVVFDGTSTANCTIDMDIDVNSISINAGYTGIVDAASTNPIIESTFTQAAGTFLSTDQILTIGGNMTATGGTFSHMNGVVEVFIGSGASIVMSGTWNFNSLVISVTGLGSVQRSMDFGAGGITTSSLTLNSTSKLYTYKGTVNITGDLSILGTNVGNPTGNTGVFNFTGGGPISITGTGAAGRNKIANITMNTTGAVSMTGHINMMGTWLSTNVGSFTSGSSTLNFYGAACVVTGGLTAATAAYFDNVAIQSAATLGITNGTMMDMSGNLTHNGTFNANTSCLKFSGAGAHAVNGTATLTTVNAILKNGAGSLSFSHATDLNDSLKISGGSVTGTNLTLKSTSSLKGRIAEISGGGSLAGNISVETFIPGGNTDWAVLGASGVSGLTFNSWYGTIPMAIEGSTTGVTSAGGQYFESVQGWTESDAYGYDTTITVTSPITVGKGYWVFVGTSLSSSGPITTKVSGSPVTGSQPIVLSKSAQAGSCLLANPFASPISWDRINAANPGVTTGAIYVYNADVGITTSYAGGVSTPNAPTSISSTIPMGQGFYVVSNGVGPLVIDETSKVSNNTGANPLLKTTTASTIGSVLYLQLTDGTYFDETAIRFHGSATPAYDNNLDAVKYFDSPGYIGYPGVWTARTTISTQGPGVDYSINSLPYATSSNAVIPVLAKVYTSGQHTISASGISNLPPGTCVDLKDKLLNVVQDLTLGNYVCNIMDTTTTARFELTVCGNISLGVNNVVVASDNVLIKQDANGVYVDLNFENKTTSYISATNVLGQQIMNPKQVDCVSGKYYLDLNAKDQVVLVSVIANNKRTTKKFFVANQN
jgi:hypothetical protein